MAVISAVQGQLISAANTAVNQLKLTDPGAGDASGGGPVVPHMIAVRDAAAGVKFGVAVNGVAPVLTAHDAILTDETLVISCRNGDLFFQQSANGDDFRVTIAFQQ